MIAVVTKRVTVKYHFILDSPLFGTPFEARTARAQQRTFLHVYALFTLFLVACVRVLEESFAQPIENSTRAS